MPEAPQVDHETSQAEQSAGSKLLAPEVIGRTEYFNYSGRFLEQVLSWFPHDLKAEKVVLLPDLTRGRSPLPTGCMVEFDMTVQPEWRKFAVSDVGCGMSVARLPLTWEQFEDDRAKWDKVAERLLKNKGGLGDLGGGNHFLDAVVDAEENVYAVVHTGSRSESNKATDLVDNPEEFDRVYSEAVFWAKQNRQAILQIVGDVYGDFEPVLDKVHNFYKVEDNRVRIYKGSVELAPGERTIIPSSMDGGMVIVTGSDAMRVIRAMSHGTGRVKSRREAKEAAETYDKDGLMRRVYMPELVRNTSIVSELPFAYRNLDECLALVADLVEPVLRLDPVAYIGGI